MDRDPGRGRGRVSAAGAHGKRCARRRRGCCIRPWQRKRPSANPISTQTSGSPGRTGIAMEIGQTRLGRRPWLRYRYLAGALSNRRGLRSAQPMESAAPPGEMRMIVAGVYAPECESERAGHRAAECSAVRWKSPEDMAVASLTRVRFESSSWLYRACFSRWADTQDPRRRYWVGPVQVQCSAASRGVSSVVLQERCC